MNENGLEKFSPPVVKVVRDEPAEPAAEPAPVNPLVKLRILLHGRYAYAVILGLLFGAGAGFAAWKLTPPKYEIVGYVRVKLYVPKVIYGDGETGMLPG